MWGIFATSKLSIFSSVQLLTVLIYPWILIKPNFYSIFPSKQLSILALLLPRCPLLQLRFKNLQTQFPHNSSSNNGKEEGLTLMKMSKYLRAYPLYVLRMVSNFVKTSFPKIFHLIGTRKFSSYRMTFYIGEGKWKLFGFS